MEFVTESGVVSIIVTCQRVVEPREIHYREWSRVVAIVVTCREFGSVGWSSVEMSDGAEWLSISSI